MNYKYWIAPAVATGAFVIMGFGVMQAGLVQGIYQNPQPTLTNGQTTPLQIDINGNLKTTAVMPNWPTGTLPVSDSAAEASLAQIITELSGPLQVGNFPASQVVSGSVGVTGAVGVNNFPTTYPVTGTFWQATQPISGTVTANVQGGNSTAVKVDGSAVTQPVSLASSPLPAGAATAANQSTEIAALNSISASVSSPSTPSYSGKLITFTAGTLLKSGSGVLHTINVTKTGVLSSFQVYDGTSTGGTLMVDGTTVISGVSPPILLDYAFTNGLYVVSAGTTAPAFTVTWK